MLHIPMFFATPDRAKGSCWSNGPNKNRWFKFVATTDFIKVTVKINGSEGTMRNPFVAIWDASLNELACQRNISSTTDIESSYLGLTPGATYYISVDSFVGYKGTFTLCVTDIQDYDFHDFAKVIPHAAGWCSANAEYSNYWATADEIAGSCWTGGTSRNVWFEFTAASNEINIMVSTGGAAGAMRGQQIALWDNTGTEITCINGPNNFSGSLTLSFTSLIIGNNYYISVDDRKTNGSFSLCLQDNAITWTGNIDTDWNTGGNWVGGVVPVITDNIAIPDISSVSGNFPVITSVAEADNALIHPSASLTINPNFSLTVSALLKNLQGNSGLIIKSDATGTGSVINSGIGVPATVEQYFTGTQWHYISSSVENTPLSLFNTNNFYYYDETKADWWTGATISGDFGWTTHASNLASMQGYAYYYYQTTLNFTGNLHAGTYTSPPLSWTSYSGAGIDDKYAGWHLLGNPFPSAIDWESGTLNGDIILTGVDNTICYYDDVAQNYKYFNGNIAQGTPYTGSLNDGSRYIPAMQGFFVRASLAGGQVQITDNARTHSTVAFYKSTNDKSAGKYLILCAKANGLTDEIALVEKADATRDYDGKYDAYKMYSTNENTPQIYLFENENEFAVNAVPTLNQDEVYKLGFSGNNSEIYEISLKESNLEAVYLFDKLENTTHNLTEIGKYTFKHAGGNTFDRFGIRFTKSKEILADISDGILIFPNPTNGIINIDAANSNIQKLTIFDITGKQIIVKTTIQQKEQVDLSNFERGIYIIKIQTDNEILTTKIVKE